MKRAFPSTFAAGLLALALLTTSTCAQAETWRVDLIVFRFLSSIEEKGRLPQAPSLHKAIELDDVNALSAAGITVLPESEFALNDEWARLKASPQFRPLVKLAWTQNDPPPAEGPRLHVISGATIRLRDEAGLGEREFREVDGSVALHLGRYLHLDTALIFTSSGEEPQSWLLEESRKMRSDEMHHLDSPRLGVLARVGKWGPGLTSTVPATSP